MCSSLVETLWDPWPLLCICCWNAATNKVKEASFCPFFCAGVDAWLTFETISKLSVYDSGLYRKSAAPLDSIYPVTKTHSRF